MKTETYRQKLFRLRRVRVANTKRVRARVVDQAEASAMVRR